MNDFITVTGMVLSAMPVGEYDKRIVLLTRERGKICAFAKGARRPTSPFMAAANPFVFGSFTLYEGRTSYNLNQVSVTHHFAELAQAQPGIYYGYYFLELADYFGREGTDEREMMNLLYVTVKALLNSRIDNRLIRCVYELRTMAEQGMMPEVTQCAECAEELELSGEKEYFFSQDSHGALCRCCASKIPDAQQISCAALYAMQYICLAPMGKLYTFGVSREVLGELEHHISLYTARNTDRRFKSLQILEMMC